MVFGCRAKHRWTANIDVLDGIFVCHIRFRNSLLEWVQVHDNQIDIAETEFFHLACVLFVITHSQQPTMNCRMQCFDTSVHDFRKSGHIRNSDDRYAFLRQQAACTSCRNNLHTHLRQLAAKVHDACFIPHTDQSSFDTHNMLLL
ncbi:hypothetical protein D3C76_1275600 [compost metagenome]